LHEERGGVPAGLDVALYLLLGLATDDRRHEGGRVVRRADDEALNRRAEARQHLVVSRAHNDETAAGAALLARVAEGGHQHAGDGLVKVSVLVDDDGVLSAHLGNDVLHAALARPYLRRVPDDAQAHRLAAGEGDYRDVRVPHEG